MNESDKAPAMNSEKPDFYELVAQMRHVQKEYFRTRSQMALEESKRLERQVDKELEERDQPKLFE